MPWLEFCLDVIAAIGRLRHAEHRSVPEIHAQLNSRGVSICVRSVASLLDRYHELLALLLSDPSRLHRVTAEAGRVILAVDGLQPEVGHEVLLGHPLRRGPPGQEPALLLPGRSGQAARRGPPARGGHEDDEATAIRGYCAAIRTSQTDDGRSPLAASDLVSRDRLGKFAASLDEVASKRGSRGN
ncbi:hypothetical protein EP7_001943 [Isosphaeraceae bacterium EP7]